MSSLEVGVVYSPAKLAMLVELVIPLLRVMSSLEAGVAYSLAKLAVLTAVVIRVPPSDSGSIVIWTYVLASVNLSHAYAFVEGVMIVTLMKDFVGVYSSSEAGDASNASRAEDVSLTRSAVKSVGGAVIILMIPPSMRPGTEMATVNSG
jgi:hypothetical protein